MKSFKSHFDKFIAIEIPESEAGCTDMYRVFNTDTNLVVGIINKEDSFDCSFKPTDTDTYLTVRDMDFLHSLMIKIRDSK